MLLSQWGFLQPWMLWSLLSLFIPIAIHFLSRSKGKLVPFANVALIKVLKPVKMTQIRLVDRLLLLLRLLFLIIASMILAQFYFALDKSNDAHVVFITEDWLRLAPQAEKEKLISRINDQTNANTSVKPENYYLLTFENTNTIYQEIDVEILKNKENDEGHIKQNLYKSLNQPINLWQMIANVSDDFSEQQSFSIYSTKYSHQFFQTKPLSFEYALANRVKWHLLPLSAGIVNQSEFDSSLDQAHAFEAIVNPIHVNVVLNETSEGEKELKFKINQALLLIKKLLIPQLTVTYFSSQNDFLKKIKTSKRDSAKDIWLFDLSVNRNNSSLLSTLLTQENLNKIKVVVAQESWDENIPELVSLQHTENNVSYQQQVLSIFDKFALKEKVIYQLSLSQNNSWLQLANKVEFPQVLATLLLNDKVKENFEVQSMLTVQQISSPIITVYNESPLASKNLTKGQAESKSYLTHFSQQSLLVVLFLLWMLERILSEYRSVYPSKTEIKSHRTIKSNQLKGEIDV